MRGTSPRAEGRGLAPGATPTGQPSLAAPSAGAAHPARTQRRATKRHEGLRPPSSAHPTGSRSSPGPSTDRSVAVARYIRQRPSPLTSSVVNRPSPCASEARE